MTNIELPIWLLLLLVGTPTLCVLFMAIRSVRRGRLKKDTGSGRVLDSSILTSNLDPTFQQDLHSLQIDAVFNALTALIETERIKLKSLLCPTLSYLPAYEVSDQQIAETDSGQVDHVEADMNAQIMARSNKGESIGEIANDLGISKSEVSLAISMRQTVSDETTCRLEAVA